MQEFAKRAINNLLKLLGVQLVRKQYVRTLDSFRSDHYIRHNQRRQEHLASLNLNFTNKTVLEVGAGIGDHSTFWIDRNCEVTITEAREESLKVLRTRFPGNKILQLDMDDVSKITSFNSFDIVYCYGLLYHLKNPADAIKFMSTHSQNMLLLETCVSFGEDEKINNVDENMDNPSQSSIGVGCRPTRVWVYNQLKKYFDFVYMPITQPAHSEFPLDWNKPSPVIIETNTPLSRAVFIASKKELKHPLLVQGIPSRQYISGSVI